VDLSPDPNGLSWQVSGAGSAGGTISRNTFDQGGSFGATFPLPLHVKPGTYQFELTVTGTETCGSDPAKTLTGVATKSVTVEVLANPKTPPR
jgi:hypothetical protein